MDSVLKLICALAVSASLQSSVSAQGMEDAWETRISTTLTLLKTRPCWGLSREADCHHSVLGNLDTRRMRLHTAAGQKELHIVLPDRRQHRLTLHSSRNNSCDAAFVLDPYPEAGFGHVVFLFLVNYDVNETTCNKSMNGVHVFTDRNECIRRAEKFHGCKNRIDHRQVKCEINFVPLVHYKDDMSKIQRLQCRQKLKALTFAGCDDREDFPSQCSENAPRCDDSAYKPEKFCTYKRCDHAVLISGGWNSYTSHPRYRRNLRNVWALLQLTMRYKKQHIKTFLGQGQREELAEEQRERSYVVDRTTRVREYITNLCRSLLCVDTLTLYLTGPANSDGALMFWDRREDGITDNSELYTPKQLLDDIKNCSAKRVFLVADYSYSGAMINRLEKRKKRHQDQFRNIIAISSTGWGEYAWRSDFIDAFINKNKEGQTTKCLAHVFEEVKQDLRMKGSLATPQMIAVNSSAANTTLNGNPCNETWTEANARHPCQLIQPINLPRTILSPKTP